MTNAWLVILNWNGRADTLELLSSLSEADLPNTTVLVVDNGSSDGTIEAVRATHPWVKTLQTGNNLGFAGGNNSGINFAQQHGADVIGILNNDTLVARDFWPPLVSVANQDATAVSPDIRYAKEPDRSWFYGGVSSRTEGWARHLQDNEQLDRQGLKRTEILTGCCLVASTETWREVGGFDESLFLIFEDSDWSMRAREKGVDLVLQPLSRIEHKVSRSFQGPQSELGLYYFCRNGTIFASRWLGPAATLRFCQRVFRDGIRAIRREGRVAARPLLVRCIAVCAAAGGRRGPAGPLVRRIAISQAQR